MRDTGGAFCVSLDDALESPGPDGAAAYSAVQGIDLPREQAIVELVEIAHVRLHTLKGLPPAMLMGDIGIDPVDLNGKLGLGSSETSADDIANLRRGRWVIFGDAAESDRLMNCSSIRCCLHVETPCSP